MSFEIDLLCPSVQKQKRIERGIIASIALHNLFEILNPEFLRLKEAGEKPSESNSLGIEVYRGLLCLGFWRKILFIMDYERSLSLASFFADFTSYKTIFLTMNKKYKNKVSCIESIRTSTTPDFKCLPFDDSLNPPETSADIEMAMIALEHIISNFTKDISKSYKVIKSEQVI